MMTASDENEDVKGKDQEKASADEAQSENSVPEASTQDSEPVESVETNEASSVPKLNNGSSAKGEEQDGIQNGSSDDPSSGSNGTASEAVRMPSSFLPQKAAPAEPAKIAEIPIGDPKVKSKLRFEVVTARVIEQNGKKHVSYTIMMKRANGHDPRPAVIERRYNDFCYVYEMILKHFHPSILGDFLFPKKVLLGNFKAEVITERTEAFHRLLNLIANCDNLLYSDYFYSFLCSEEHNEAVSHIKLSRYEEAIPLLEAVFYVQEKLLTIANIHVLQCLCELVATLHAIKRYETAFSYAMLAAKSFDLIKGHPDAESIRVSFLQLTSTLASALAHDPKPFDRQLSELRYNGVRLENAKPLLEIIRERYIHRASHTAKLM